MSGLDAEINNRIQHKFDPALETKALEWIGSIVNIKPPKVIGNLGESLYKWLKNGVILCKLLNCIKPNTIPENKITLNPRHSLEERENITLYLGGCLRIGVPSQDIFILPDLHSRKSMHAVLTNIYALGRQAQVIPSFNGPKLGVTYNISIEEQQKRAEKKKHERERRAMHRRMKSDCEIQRRLELENEQREEVLNTLEVKETRKLTRKLSKGRISLSDFRQKSSENLKKFKELKRTTSDISELVPNLPAVKYGMDRDTEKRRKRQYSTEKEEQVMDWIEAVTGDHIDSFYDDLKDGRILCKLLNTIRPNTIRRINTRDVPIAHRDNIQLYISGCFKFGVSTNCLFTINDLYEQKDLNAVVNSFFMLSRKVESLSTFNGPYLKLDGNITTEPEIRSRAYSIPTTNLMPTKHETLSPKREIEEKIQKIPQKVQPQIIIEEPKEEKENIKDINEEIPNLETVPRQTNQVNRISFFSYFTPRFLVRSLYNTIMSVRYFFFRR